MGADFAIVIESREPTPVEISDADIEAYYRAHLPPGAPPLETIREHVVRAIALERSADAIDPIAALHARFVDHFGRDRLWWDSVLEAAAIRLGVTPLARFQKTSQDDEVPDSDQTDLRAEATLRSGPAYARWCDAADGLRTVRALQAYVREALADRTDYLECLAIVEAILVIAEREHRRWRLHVMW